MIVPERGGLKYGTALQTPPTQPGAAGSMSPLAAQQQLIASLSSAMPQPAAMAASTEGLPSNVMGLTNFRGDISQPSSVAYETPSSYQRPAPKTMPHYASTTYGSNLGDMNQGSAGFPQPMVVGDMADSYAQGTLRGLGGMNQGLGNALTGTGGRLGEPLDYSFGNELDNMPIPQVAAETVGRTVSRAIQSRLPEMSQGIGSLIGRTLLSQGGGFKMF